MAGELIELCDGNFWEAPIVREQPTRYLSSLRLPKTFRLGADDTVVAKIKPAFVEFQKIADRIWDSYWGVAGSQMGDADVLKAAIKLLSLNYRLGREECNALELLDSENIGLIFRASNNLRVVEELVAESKKNDSLPLPSEPSVGDVDSTQLAALSANA